MNKVVPCITFVVGGVIGASITYFTVKKKYQHEANEQIASIREMYSNRIKELELDNKTAKVINKYKERVQSYSANEDESESEISCDIHSDDEPYIIAEDQFGLYEDYEPIVLRYFSDGMIIDDSTDEIITAVDDLIGYDNLNEFEKLPPDAQEVIFVRNDKLHIDYQIVRDRGTMNDYYEDYD